MSNFDLLHPALKHHITNSLGWRELRPFQEDVIPHLLAGKHAIILAPTAGGKTEASLFPVLSRMLAEGWSGLSTLYVCPIKALLNNLVPFPVSEFRDPPRRYKDLVRTPTFGPELT